MKTIGEPLHLCESGGCWHYPATCALCGKTFYRTALHAYKIIYKNRTQLFCSYTCFRKAERMPRFAKGKGGRPPRKKAAAQ